jgi:hypothetical protein
VASAFARAPSAGSSPWWRIASGARLRRSRGYRTKRGLTAGQHHCGCAFGQVAVSPNRAPRAPGQVGSKVELMSVQVTVHAPHARDRDFLTRAG